MMYSAAFYITVERLTHDFLATSGQMFDGFRGQPQVGRVGGEYWLARGEGPPPAMHGMVA